MILVIRLIGVAMIAGGLYLFLTPQAIEAMLRFWKEGKRIYYGAGIRIGLGICFLWAAPLCRIPVVIGLVGGVALLSGILVLTLGLQKCKDFLGRLESLPVWPRRVMALTIFGIGILLWNAA